jgi:hypothetical protein
MTSIAIVLPRLTAWVQGSVRALAQAKDTATFDRVFDDFIGNPAEITVNGKRMSREAYKDLLQAQHALQQSADVNFGGAVEVPKDPEDQFKVCGQRQLEAAIHYMLMDRLGWCSWPLLYNDCFREDSCARCTGGEDNQLVLEC